MVTFTMPPPIQSSLITAARDNGTSARAWIIALRLCATESIYLSHDGFCGEVRLTALLKWNDQERPRYYEDECGFAIGVFHSFFLTPRHFCACCSSVACGVSVALLKSKSQAVWRAFSSDLFTAKLIYRSNDLQDVCRSFWRVLKFQTTVAKSIRRPFVRQKVSITAE